MPWAWAASMKPHEAVGPAVGLLDGEGVGRVVAPRVVGGELGGGHELHGVDAQGGQVGQLLGGGAELPRVAAGPVVEGADVQLVDDQVVPAGHLERGAAAAGEVDDHRVPGRVGDQAGVGVDSEELLAAG